MPLLRSARLFLHQELHVRRKTGLETCAAANWRQLAYHPGTVVLVLCLDLAIHASARSPTSWRWLPRATN